MEPWNTASYLWSCLCHLVLDSLAVLGDLGSKPVATLALERKPIFGEGMLAHVQLVQGVLARRIPSRAASWPPGRMHPAQCQDRCLTQTKAGIQQSNIIRILEELVEQLDNLDANEGSHRGKNTVPKAYYEVATSLQHR